MNQPGLDQLRKSLNVISGEIVDAAMKVHSALGPRLLESAYLACLAHELRSRALAIEVQKSLPVVYEGLRIELGYRIDLPVEDAIIVELKVASKLHPVHEAQLLSYLRLSNKKLGLLINVHVTHLKDGIKRIVNNM
jgi:GxxExxY protein